MERPNLKFKMVTLDCREPRKLARFYLELLGCAMEYDGEEFVVINPPDGGANIGFQRNELYEPPVWPEQPGCQQQMEHIDIRVLSREERDLAVTFAESLGARRAPTQFSDNWTVMLDPEGHPFCLDLSD